MRRGLAVLLGVSAIAVVFACSSFTGDPPSAGDPDASSSDPADASDDGAVQDPTPIPVDTSTAMCPKPVIIARPVVMDALIGVASADQPRNDIGVCNMVAGRCLFRFALGSEVADAFASSRVFALALSITRADSNEECGGGSTACVALREDGILSGNPVNPQWDKAQVTWNSRRNKPPLLWAAPGAGGTDLGELAGRRFASASTVVVDLDLDPKKWTPPFIVDGGLAIRTSFEDDAGARKQFVAVLRQGGGIKAAKPDSPASLTIGYCP